MDAYSNERVSQDILEGKTYTTSEFAEKVGRTPRTLDSWRKRGILVPRKDISGRNIYTHSDYLLCKGLIVREKEGKDESM